MPVVTTHLIKQRGFSFTKFGILILIFLLLWLLFYQLWPLFYQLWPFYKFCTMRMNTNFAICFSGCNSVHSYSEDKVSTSRTNWKAIWVHEHTQLSKVQHANCNWKQENKKPFAHAACAPVNFYFCALYLKFPVFEWYRKIRKLI